MKTNLDFSTKVSAIDNYNNRMEVAQLIISDFDINGQTFPKLNNWLMRRLCSRSLGTLLTSDFALKKMAANKLLTDAFVKTRGDEDGFLKALSCNAELGTFIALNIGMSIKEWFDDVSDNGLYKEYVDMCEDDDFLGNLDSDGNERVKIDFDKTDDESLDTIVFDDVRYTLITTKDWVLKLNIGYHKDYTIENLKKRIIGRLSYQFDVEIKSIFITKKDNGFYAEVRFTCSSWHDEETIYDEMEYRFSKTSGKPWYRSSIKSVDEVED